MNWRRIVLTFLIAAAALYLPAILAYSWSLTGLYDLDIFGVFIFLLVPTLAAISAVLTLVACVFVKLRPVAASALVVALALIPTAIPAELAARELRMLGFRLMTERAAPLVDAVIKYERDRGMPPTSVQQLVPIYLAKIPRPLSRVQVLTGDRAHKYFCKGDRWVLMMSVSIGVLNFDEFFYLPGQNYEKCETNIERIGLWAYHHE